jgi:hypothetical protein
MEPSESTYQKGSNENPLAFVRGFHEWVARRPLCRREAANGACV